MRHRRAVALSGLSVSLVLGLFAAAPSAAEEIRVLVASYFAEPLSELEGRFPDLEIVTFGTQSELLERVAGAAAVVGLSPRADIAAILEAAPSLRWVQTTSAGVEALLREAAFVASEVVLTNAKIIQGPEIADHALALLLNLTRDMKFFNEQMERGFVRRSRLPLIELRGKTALVIGLGGIGNQVAERAAAFGMRVLAVDPKDMPLRRDVTRVVKPDELHEVLPEADVIFSCVPWTPATEGMLGVEEFELMKDGVYLVNVSRGAIIDTEALTAALQSGKVRAAGLDVTHPEPLPKDHPLWSMENVTITPHIAGASDGIQARRMELFRENVERFLAGRPLRNVVAKGKGF